ncbi:MAG: hypothetical protein MUF03_00525 [Rubrivivax sp.]|jgi:hypothetical protein|nr:hypothetical protein [Rubrivivax sp.]
MRLFARRPHHARVPLSQRRAEQALLALVETAASADAAPAAGAGDVGACGWYDSSHDLQRGLAVTEHPDPSPLGAELPLEDWLRLHLSGWQPELADPGC